MIHNSSIPSPEYSNCELLYKNIKNVHQSSIRVEPIKLFIEDANNSRFLKINLHKTELQNKHITSIKLKFISKKLDDNQIFTQEYIDSNLTNVKYNLMCGHNVIFDDDFYQDTILLTSGLILPLKYIKDHHSVCINIMNISNMLSLLNDLELQILYDEVEFKEEFDGLMSTRQIDQLIQTKTNTYNVFRVMFGMGVKAIDIDLPKDKFNEIAHKIDYRILV
jgi:hypothetical protein